MSLRILLSNDDGIYAPGLKTLEKIAQSLSDDVWVVAPKEEQSGASHSLTLHKPLRMQKISERRYAVDGTPTDCILMAMEQLFRERGKPDLVLSGVNMGVNLAEDVTYSGTVAAAMEATLLEIPSIALSLAITDEHPAKWQTALEHAPHIIRKLLDVGWPKDVLININFPNVIAKSVQGTRVCPMGKRPPFKTFIKAIDPRGNPYYWVGPPPKELHLDNNTDLSAVDKGYISVTPLHLDLTHTRTLNLLQKHL